MFYNALIRVEKAFLRKRIAVAFFLVRTFGAQPVYNGFNALNFIARMFERDGNVGVTEQVAYFPATLANKVRMARRVRIEMSASVFRFERIQLAAFPKLAQVAVNRSQTYVGNFFAHFFIYRVGVGMLFRVSQHFEYRFPPTAVTHKFSCHTRAYSIRFVQLHKDICLSKIFNNINFYNNNNYYCLYYNFFYAICQAKLQYFDKNTCSVL